MDLRNTWTDIPGKRQQPDVRQVTEMLRNRFVQHIVEAKGITGRDLPGPIPELLEHRPFLRLNRNPSREKNHD